MIGQKISFRNLQLRIGMVLNLEGSLHLISALMLIFYWFFFKWVNDLLQNVPFHWNFPSLKLSLNCLYWKGLYVLYSKKISVFSFNFSRIKLVISISNYDIFVLGEQFKLLAGKYLRYAFRKGIFALFVDLHSLYKDHEKVEILHRLVINYLELLQSQQKMLHSGNCINGKYFNP